MSESGDEGEENVATTMSRKEKRKAMKRKKRKEKRKEMAEKEREEEEIKLNDLEEQKKLEKLEEEERERVERERKEFEERERVWMEKMMMKKKEDQRKLLEESRTEQEVANEDDCSDDWEYVEEGPAEIIWKGNEIIVKKKQVRVSKKQVEQRIQKEDADRPTSNPLPPQSETFADFKGASIVSGQHVYETVAQQVPNFGTEQDKAHCPFHIKTGACRFGLRCSRVHFYPDKSCTLLIKNMYSGPGLAWEQDEGLEVKCEFVGVTKWKVAICGEYMKSRLKTCSRGTACNFIHCFRNPGGDYEWADWDKPPPKYWVKKMVALFGHADVYDYEKHIDQESPDQMRNSSRMTTADSDRYYSSRPRSRDRNPLNNGSRRSLHKDDGDGKSTWWQRHTNDEKMRTQVPDESKYEDRRDTEDNYHQESRSRHQADSDGNYSDKEKYRKNERHNSRKRNSFRHKNEESGYLDDNGEADLDGDWSDRDKEQDRNRHRSHKRKSSGQREKVFDGDSDQDSLESERYRDKHNSLTNKSSRCLRKASRDRDEHGDRRRRDRGSHKRWGSKRRRHSPYLDHDSGVSNDDYSDRKRRTHHTDSWDGRSDSDEEGYDSSSRKQLRQGSEISDDRWNPE